MNTNLDRQISPARVNHGFSGESENAARTGNHIESADLLGALWRYRWAVILPAIAGAIIGFMVYLKTPETHRSTTKLMVESEQPAIMDSMTGDLIGGVPSLEILESQLFSDRVLQMAYENEQMAPFRESEGNSLAGFFNVARDSLSLESDGLNDMSAQAIVTLMHFESTDAELCQSAVSAFSDSLQQFFNEKQKSSRSELLRLINVATDKIHPKIDELEQRYREFREDAPLVWNADGEAINPHRERQMFLVQRRSEQVQILRAKLNLLGAIEDIDEESSDPILSLGIIGQLLGIEIRIPETDISSNDAMASDVKLGGLEIDQQLVPLMVKRNQYAAEFGDSHPTVRQLDAELTVMKSELKRLFEEQSKRMLQIAEENVAFSVDPIVRAKEAIKTVLIATRAEIGLLQKDIGDLEIQIAGEKSDATKLSKVEQENAAILREIDRNRELINDLQEQMARVTLTEEESGTKVIQLAAPTRPYLVGPSLTKSLGFGTFLGIALGAGLALLLEKNANTFRDPDEIAQILGAPVLTHVPFFKGRIKKPKKGEVNPYKDLDPYLSVVHAPASIVSEAIRSCRTSVFFETAGPGGKIIQVTSPLPGDGKSTIAGNLACSIAQSGKRVLAIDCDLRRPQLTDNFAMQTKIGLTNVLNGECDPDDASHQSPIATLRVMPSGAIPANPAEALTLPEMVDLMNMLREQYDYVILDTPPLLVVTDPSITASMVDGVILALRVRRKSKPNAKESLNILRAVGARVLGVVINNSDETSASDGYRGYGYYRYGRYTSRYYRRSGKGGATGTQSTTKTRSAAPVVVSGRGIVKRSSARQAAEVSVPSTAEPVDDQQV